MRYHNVFKGLPFFGGDTTKQGYGGLVGIAASVVMSAIQTIRPDWLGNHPWILPVAFVFLAISLLLFFAQYKWFQRLLGISYETPAMLPQSAPVSSSSTVTAPATASIGAVTIAPVFNNQTGTRMAVNGELLDGTKLAPVTAPPVERPKPNLIPLGIHKVVQAEHNSAFDTRNGDVIYTLRVQNSVRGAIIQGAIASIRFDGKDGMLGMVERAYWYGEYPHEVEFQLNATRSLVLGKCADGRWYHFNNPMRHLPHFDRSSYTEPDPPESFAMDDSCTMIVEIFNPYRGDIYLEKSFVISRTGTDCTIFES